MSNFICPHCGMDNIDCGKDGYKTAKEIELENKIKTAKEKISEAKNCLNVANADDTDMDEHFENVEKAEEILNEVLENGI